MSDRPDLGEMVQVHLLALPVPLAAQAQEHFQELLREFVLISSEGPGSAEHVPARLLSLVDALTQQFGGMNTAAEDRLEDAIRRGLPVIDDHVLEVPNMAAEPSRQLGHMIDEADEFCRAGQHLLTLAASPELVDYRHWYLGQVTDQIGGQPPVSWPDYSAARARA